MYIWLFTVIIVINLLNINLDDKSTQKYLKEDANHAIYPSYHSYYIDNKYLIIYVPCM